MRTVAIVGRTNVGKSTLFNRLCGRKLAIVHNEAGVTRDRKEAEAHLTDLSFRLVDTAGLEETTSLAAAMWKQTETAVSEADVVLAVVDGRSEITPLDVKMAQTLRKSGKKIILTVNKCEGEIAYYTGRFYRLGLGEPVAVSAEHGLGLSDLYDALKQALPEEAPFEKENKPEDFVLSDEIHAKEKERLIKQSRPLKLAVVGRPNVGKSTLINTLLGKERLLTGPAAGVTRDSVTIPWEWRGHKILLTDTAGLRKRGRVAHELEKISTAGTLKAVDFAEVVLLVLDACQPMEKQDLLIASKVLDEGRCLIIVLNKWDKIENPRLVLNQIKEKLSVSLQQVKGLLIHAVSAKTGYGLNGMMADVFKIYNLWNKRVQTHKLNDFLSRMTAAHPTPVASNGKRIPMKYMTQISTRPPAFVIFSSNPAALPESYLRYLSNGIRENYGLEGVPIRIVVRKQLNPYKKGKA